MILLYNTFKHFQYNNSNSLVTSAIYCPLNVDSEFYNLDYKDKDYSINPSPTLTIQVRGIESDDTGTIYGHRDCADISRHPLMIERFIGLQYLKDKGYNITCHKSSNKYLLKELPKFHFHLYCHFAVAEIMRIAYGDIKESIKELIVNSKNSGSGITQENRTRTYTRCGRNYYHYALLPYIVNYNRISYQLSIEIHDSIGLTGNNSYATLAKLADFELPHKDKLTQKDKENMKDTYLNNPEFDNYALGDLFVYEMFKGIKSLVTSISEDIKIPIELKHTIGSTVANTLETALMRFHGIADKKMFKSLTVNANSDFLRKLKDTRALLSKVDGGRCFNNRPTTIKLSKTPIEDVNSLVTSQSSLVDIDISGAYGKGLSIQDYPIGNPKTFVHLLDNDFNKYLTLREFLQLHGHELVDGLWTMRVSTAKTLKYPQDFITSWIVDVKKIDRLSTEDKDDIYADYPKEGYSKIFSNEIKLGTVTSDILDIILNICSRLQKDELLDNLLVINAMWYDKKFEVSNYDELLSKIADYKGDSTSTYVSDKLNNIFDRCHYWCRVNLGKLFINKLLQKRAEYDKSSPYNTFYKLMINTTYGVLVSKYFNVGNSVVGNNITARCRCMAWYMEKGLNGVQSITDGCVFELDNVAFPVSGRRLTANNLVSGYRESTNIKRWYTDKLKINLRRKIKLDSGYELFFKFEDLEIDYESDYFKEFLNSDYYKSLKEDYDNGVRITYEDLRKSLPISDKEFQDNLDMIEGCYSIEDDVLEHLRNIFPKVKVLHEKIINNDGVEQLGYYTLEIKRFASDGVFHGNANYKLSGCKENKKGVLVDSDDVYKMRGYKSDKCFVINDYENEIGLLEDDDFYDSESIDKVNINIPKTFMDNLSINPNSIDRILPFNQSSILKIKEYKNNYLNKYINTNLIVGSTLNRLRLLRELSIGQFLFRDSQQFEKWLKRHNQHKEKFGQGLESNYCSEDGLSLNYALLISEIDESIMSDSKINLRPIKHPYLDLLRNELNLVSDVISKKD